MKFENPRGIYDVSRSIPTNNAEGLDDSFCNQWWIRCGQSLYSSSVISHNLMIVSQANAGRQKVCLEAHTDVLVRPLSMLSNLLYP